MIWIRCSVYAHSHFKLSCISTAVVMEIPRIAQHKLLQINFISARIPAGLDLYSKLSSRADHPPPPDGRGKGRGGGSKEATDIPPFVLLMTDVWTAWVIESDWRLNARERDRTLPARNDLPPGRVWTYCALWRQGTVAIRSRGTAVVLHCSLQ